MTKRLCCNNFLFIVFEFSRSDEFQCSAGGLTQPGSSRPPYFTGEVHFFVYYLSLYKHFVRKYLRVYNRSTKTNNSSSSTAEVLKHLVQVGTVYSGAEGRPEQGWGYASRFSVIVVYLFVLPGFVKKQILPVNTRV